MVLHRNGIAVDPVLVSIIALVEERHTQIFACAGVLPDVAFAHQILEVPCPIFVRRAPAPKQI
jgi:hypothetical protein